MGFMEQYEKWLGSESVLDADKAALKELSTDSKELEECFYRDLEFGTAGMRGILGLGTNRLNIYNVRHASLGVAQFVQKEGKAAAEKA